MLKADVIILTAYGREKWFKNKILQSGLKCICLDVSHLLGQTPFEEQQGPFGVFQSEKLKTFGYFDANWNWSFDNVNEGFNIWLKSGVVECRSPLTRHQLKSHGISSENEDYVAAGNGNSTSDKISELKNTLANAGFEKSWFSHLAHNCAAPVEVYPNESLKRAYPLPFFDKYFLKSEKKENETREESHERFQLLKYNKILQWRSLGKFLQGFQLDWSSDSGSNVGTLEGDFFILLLSRGELNFLSHELNDSFFEKKLEDPYWAWTRFSYKAKSQRFIDNMPISSVLIEDIYQSWTHENLMLLSRQKNVFNVWLKVAYHRRHDHSYLLSLSQIIEAKLKQRIPGLQIEGLEMPVTVKLDASEVAPTPFVVYNEKDFHNLARTKFQNLFLCGTEAFEQLDTTGQFERQIVIWNSIVNEIVARKNKTNKEQVEDSP